MKFSRQWKPWYEFAILGGVLTLLIVAFFWLGSNEPLILADRPRENMREPDFVLSFLQATHTEYSFEEGFVKLPANAETKQRLLQLLAGLNTSMEVTADRLTPLARTVLRKRLMCVPNASGGVDKLVHDETSPVTTSESAQIASFARQYQVILEALKRICPEVVAEAPSHPAGAMIRLHDTQHESVELTEFVPDAVRRR